MLAVLALRAGEVVSTDRLVEDLWGEEPPRAAVGSLQNLVSELRKLLGADVLVTRPPGYLLEVDRDAVDAHRFARLVAEARGATAAEDRAALLRDALGLWRGAALADVAFEPFAGMEISRLEELRLGAREDLVDAELRLGRHADLIDELEAIVTEQPFRERPRALLMLALYRSGRQAEALDAFGATRRFLRDELGLEPSPALQKLQAAILRQDPALDPPAPQRIAGLPGEERRKTVTVAYTDVVDSTALGAELDPEAYRGVLRRYGRAVRSIFERHGGTVEKFIGDAVVAVFGVPEQHEDDALRAVRAAVELRARLADVNAELEQAHGVTIEIRTGINTGEAIAGNEDSAQSFATGFAVNVGAKLQQAAGPGGILVGAATYRLVRDAVVGEPGEPLTLGRTSLPTFRILDLAGSGEGVARHQGTPLVGRDDELATLSRLFADARDERVCRLATVVGEAGIGKSRLARELATAVGGEATVVVGRCVSYGEGATYLPIAEIVRGLVADGSEAGIAALLGDDTDARLVARRVRELLGWEEGAPPAGEGFWAIRRLLEAVAGPAPLLLVLEDVHWAEPTLLDLVDHLVAQRHKVPIVVLCLARPELLETRTSWPVTVRLPPLQAEAADRLVGNLATGVPPHVRSRIVEIAEGNALFAEQLLAYALEGGEDALDAVPGSVEALLASRLDRLPENERGVLERAAVVGREFWRGAVAELSEREVTAELDALADKSLVHPTRSLLTGEEALRFHHVLIRDVAYGGITKERRSKLHERVAGWLDEREPGWDEIIGYHLEQAYRFGEELGPIDERGRELGDRAGERLGRAGIRALKRGDVPAGSGLLERATTVLHDSPLRAELLCELGPALRLVGRLDAARDALAEGGRVATAYGPEGVRLRARLELVNLDVAAGDARGGTLAELARAGIPTLEALGDDRSLGRAWVLLGDVEGSLRGQNALWAQAAERALVHYRRAGWPPLVCFLKIAFAAFNGPTPVPNAIRRCEQLLEEPDVDRYSEAGVILVLGGLDAMRGRFRRARELTDQATQMYTDLGQTDVITGLCRTMRARLELLAGETERAERLFREAHAEYERIRESGNAATQAGRLADLLCARGELEEAEHYAEISRSRGSEDDVTAQVPWRLALARIAAARGDDDRGRALAREAVALAETTDELNLRAKAFEVLGEVLTIAGSLDEAGAALREALGLYRRKGNVPAARNVRRSPAPAT